MAESVLITASVLDNLALQLRKQIRTVQSENKGKGGVSPQQYEDTVRLVIERIAQVKSELNPFIPRK
jgi:predicted RNA-binding Zn ribbon-like protein